MPDKKGSDDRAYARGFAAGRAAADEPWREAIAFINWFAEGPCGCDGDPQDPCDSCRALALLTRLDDLAGRAAASSDPPDDTWKRAGDDTPPEIERLRTAAHRRPDELIPVEEAEDAVWDVITRMNEEPAPCSGPAKRQARWLWEQSERPRVWADANGDHPILVPFPMAEQAVHVARASVAHEIVADLRAESEITGVARLAADWLAGANEYLAQIADYSPSEVADAIDSVRAQIKDALAVTDSRGKPDGASVPDQSCATCGGSGDRNGNRRAADPFGTCPGCGGTGKVAAADREAPDGPRCNCVQYIEGDVTYHASGCPRAPVSDEPKLRRDTGGEAADFLGGYPPVPDETEES